MIITPVMFCHNWFVDYLGTQFLSGIAKNLQVISPIVRNTETCPLASLASVKTERLLDIFLSITDPVSRYQVTDLVIIELWGTLQSGWTSSVLSNDEHQSVYWHKAWQWNLTTPGKTRSYFINEQSYTRHVPVTDKPGVMIVRGLSCAFIMW